LYGQWRVSETSGLWRAVCPFCEQHYSATPSPFPEPIDCSYCGKHFLIPARSEAENLVPSPPQEDGGAVVPNGEWCISSTSGQLRVVCPFCEQHYDAKPPKSPIFVTCSHCRRQFRIPVRSDTVIPSATPMAARGEAPAETAPAARPASAVVAPRSEGDILECRWLISENSGLLRAACPHCGQHFDTDVPEQSVVSVCTFCNGKFLLMPRYRLKKNEPSAPSRDRRRPPCRPCRSRR